MNTWIIFSFAAVVAVYAEDKKPSDSKKNVKRGLHGLGYGYEGFGALGDIGIHYDSIRPYGLPALSASYGHSLFAPAPLHSASIHTTITKTVPYAVPQPVAVPVEKPVPYPVAVPHPVAVDRPVPYPVTVERHVPVPVDRPVPYAVDRPVPYPVAVPHHVPYPVVKHVGVPVPQPYPVEVHRPYPVPVAVHKPYAHEAW